MLHQNWNQGHWGAVVAGAPAGVGAVEAEVVVVGGLPNENVGTVVVAAGIAVADEAGAVAGLAGRLKNEAAVGALEEVLEGGIKFSVGSFIAGGAAAVVVGGGGGGTCGVVVVPELPPAPNKVAPGLGAAKLKVAGGGAPAGVVDAAALTDGKAKVGAAEAAVVAVGVTVPLGAGVPKEKVGRAAVAAGALAADVTGVVEPNENLGSVLDADGAPNKLEGGAPDVCSGLPGAGVPAGVVDAVAGANGLGLFGVAKPGKAAGAEPVVAGGAMPACEVLAPNENVGVAAGAGLGPGAGA